MIRVLLINKSQSQSSNQVLLDITEDSFSHGHCYVAWSRVRAYNAIRLIFNSNNLIDIDNKLIAIILSYIILVSY